MIILLGNYSPGKLYIRKFEEAAAKGRRSSPKMHKMRMY